MGRQWIQFAVAILIGNALYFFALPRLPEILQHQSFRFDLGLVADFLLCVGVYLILRRWVFSRLRQR